MGRNADQKYYCEVEDIANVYYPKMDQLIALKNVILPRDKALTFTRTWEA